MDIKPGDFAGRYIRFGIREHGMGAMLNGLALHGGVIPYGGTFLVFSDYMRGAVRLSALMKAPVVYVWTHDSVGVGEDGPTHQPIEDMGLRCAACPTWWSSGRAMPTRRPQPGATRSTHRYLACGAAAQPAEPDGRCGQRGSRQDRARRLRSCRRGGRQTRGHPDRRGLQVGVAMAACYLLAAEGVQARVVSMPSWELFDEQDVAYREKSVLPAAITARVSVEAGVTMVGSATSAAPAATPGIDRFGESGKGPAVMAHLGITPENVAQKALALLGK